MLLRICDGASTLGYACSDVKPANVLLGADGRARLCDFGSAAAAVDEGEMRTFCGTPDFMSPEMLCSAGAPWRYYPVFAAYAAQDAASHGKPTDIWSLGMLAYVLLHGAAPFPHIELEQDGGWGNLAVALLSLELPAPDGVRSRPDRETTLAAQRPEWHELVFAWRARDAVQRGALLRVQISANALDFLQTLLRKDPAERPNIDAVLAHPWLAVAAGAAAEGASDAAARHIVEVAKPAAPHGPDAQAYVADTSVLDVHAALIAVDAPMRMGAAPAAHAPQAPQPQVAPPQVRSRAQLLQWWSDVERVAIRSAAVLVRPRGRQVVPCLWPATYTATPLPRQRRRLP